MLVLSRKVEDTIRFPELDITIEVVQIKGSMARLGIKAPVEVNILRGELESPTDPPKVKKVLVEAESDHAIRNKLNALTIAASVAKKLIANGQPDIAVEKLDKAINGLGQSVSEYGQTLTALLVEDAANEREMLAGFLRLHGYKVLTVSDGVEAMEHLKAHGKPDLILMDMNMPRLDGPSTIRMIRNNIDFDGVEIFAISGQTPDAAQVDVGKNRIAQWFQKPLSPTDLVSAIKNNEALKEKIARLN